MLFAPLCQSHRRHAKYGDGCDRLHALSENALCLCYQTPCQRARLGRLATEGNREHCWRYSEQRLYGRIGRRQHREYLQHAIQCCRFVYQIQRLYRLGHIRVEPSVSAPLLITVTLQ